MVSEARWSAVTWIKFPLAMELTEIHSWGLALWGGVESQNGSEGGAIGECWGWNQHGVFVVLSFSSTAPKSEQRTLKEENRGIKPLNAKEMPGRCWTLRIPSTEAMHCLWGPSFMLPALTDIPPQKKIWPCFTCSYLDPFNYHHTYSYFTIKRATSHEALELPAWGTQLVTRPPHSHSGRLSGF